MLKCAFGVAFSKFLGFIVRHRGIKIDQAKVDAILMMPEPRNIHELKSFQGKLAYLRRSISNLAGRCRPFRHLMKKGSPFKWDQTCSNAFESIKVYLVKPSVLAATIPGKPLILYIAAQERSVGALLAQENSEGKENSLYYLSRMMISNELNYLPIKKLCLALVFSIQKMKHYFQAHIVRLVSRENPIKFVISKPVLSDRLSRWYLQFQKFEIVYIPQKTVKGQRLVDFLADHPIPDDWELTDERFDENAMVIKVLLPWKMYFDRATHRGGAGAGVVFVTSQEKVLPFSFTLKQCCSNNVDEYQALIHRLEMAVDMKQLQLQVFGDSQLKLIGWLGDVTLQHVPRKKNKKADALAALASTLTLPDHKQVTIYQKWVVPQPNEDEYVENKLEHLIAVSEAAKEYWQQPIIDYLCYGILPKNLKRRTDIRRREPRFLYYKNTLHRRSFEGVLLQCLGEGEAVKALQKLKHSIRLCNLLKKVVSKSKRYWHERMEEALWACRITYHTPTQATLYSLTFGVEAVLPFERQIPLLAIQEGFTEEENARLRLAELEALDEKRLEAQQNFECYQACLSSAFNKKVHLRLFQVGDQVLAVRRTIITSHKSRENLPQSRMDHMLYKKRIQMALTSLLMLMA
ncbi:uncharacterized protein LOC129893428 [Solanum dulcamara]|uniref:uncharacterized protein LOC129893428 n=1 Tax=Solanum dulcamara TaxID=45834 RepID=UPI0024855F76|nr:uncharacterized protein LOC129893428 [Solanum dulcamara]